MGVALQLVTYGPPQTTVENGPEQEPQDARPSA